MAKNLIERSQKMTKAELEIKYQKALDKIEEQKHLAEAVEAKDKEIAELREQLRKERERQVQSVNTENLQKEHTRRVKELNHLIALHGNLLKTLQGTLDNAIELNEYFVNEVSK